MELHIARIQDIGVLDQDIIFIHVVMPVSLTIVLSLRC